MVLRRRDYISIKRSKSRIKGKAFQTYSCEFIHFFAYFNFVLKLLHIWCVFADDDEIKECRQRIIELLGEENVDKLVECQPALLHPNSGDFFLQYMYNFERQISKLNDNLYCSHSGLSLYLLSLWAVHFLYFAVQSNIGFVIGRVYVQFRFF